MSFSQDVKNEILNSTYKNTCCRHAFLEGALLVKGELVDDHIECSVEKPEGAEFLRSVAQDYDNSALILPSKIGGRRRILSLKSNSLSRFIGALSCGEIRKTVKCSFCTSSFLRGMFLACGRVTDPKKQFFLEFSVGKRENIVKELLSELGMELKVNHRGTECLLYTKNSGIIEDFFSRAALNSTSFTIMNEKILNGFVNEANRLRNFDTVNIAKAVEAANAHLPVIRELDARGLLSSLPPELEATARLRLQNPDMSLSRLSMISVPPVSKSGLSHRLTKIKKLGDEILAKYR